MQKTGNDVEKFEKIVHIFRALRLIQVGKKRSGTNANANDRNGIRLSQISYVFSATAFMYGALAEIVTFINRLMSGASIVSLLVLILCFAGFLSNSA